MFDPFVRPRNAVRSASAILSMEEAEGLSFYSGSVKEELRLGDRRVPISQVAIGRFERVNMLFETEMPRRSQAYAADPEFIGASALATLGNNQNAGFEKAFKQWGQSLLIGCWRDITDNNGRCVFASRDLEQGRTAEWVVESIPQSSGFVSKWHGFPAAQCGTVELVGNAHFNTVPAECKCLFHCLNSKRHHRG
jgi:hypothetical protein